MSVGDLRLLIGQQIGVQWLVSLALEQLRQDPFAGKLYEGDLLNAVLGAGPFYWDGHPAETALAARRFDTHAGSCRRHNGPSARRPSHVDREELRHRFMGVGAP